MNTDTSFSGLGLADPLLRALADVGYTNPTPIQAKAIPVVLTGRDLLAAAQTGTGKTAGFTLPILQRLLDNPMQTRKPGRPRCLILTPTRELTAQVEESVKAYAKYTRIRSVLIFGGVSINPQIQALRQPVDILVATPGRLLDHVQQGTVDLSGVEIFVLDEADRMLDMGFIDDIRTIMQMLPKPRQTLLFSATFAPAIRKLAQDFMNAPQIVEVAAQNTTNANVEEHVISIDSHRKRELLERLIVDLNMNQVIVFCKTKQSADQVSRDLVRRGLSANAIHGDKSQQTRLDVLNQFKSGELRVLVATDVAARGLDIAELPFVVNYEMPTQAEDYVHRIGRTGRAGADGVAISLMDETEQKMYEAIKALTGNELPISRIEGFEPRWEQVQAEGNLKNENSPRSSSRRSEREPQERGEKNDRRASSRNERGSRYQEIPTVDASKIPPRTSSRRRGRERRTCALLQRNFGVEA
ncbi:DEAD/DEAH box helicase [Kingella oralis]|uniref:DEAD/DEAH box helicase n=1 Tax=Kingella oralis TaxID=505 RepID=UPI003C6F9E7A